MLISCLDMGNVLSVKVAEMHWERNIHEGSMNCTQIKDFHTAVCIWQIECTGSD